MPKANRVCKVCGKLYYYCPSCAKGGKNVLGRETWHALVDSSECHVIFDTLQKYYLKKLTAEEAWNLVKDYDLSEVANEAMKAQLEELKASVSVLSVSEVETKPRARRKKKVEEAETTPVAEVKEVTLVTDEDKNIVVADENPVNEIN